MRKISAIIISCLLPAITIGQTGGIEKLFKKYKKVEGFQLEITKTEGDINTDNKGTLFQFLNEIDEIYVLNFNYGEGDLAQLKTFKLKLQKLIDKDDYMPVIELSGEDDFRILLRKGRDNDVTEVLMISADEEESSFILATD